MTDRIFRRSDIILIVCLLAVSAAALLLTGLIKNGGRQVKLTYGDGTEIIRPLSEDARIDVESNGYHVHIVIEDGKAAFNASECPDHICEGYGQLSREGETAVCLPAKAFLIIL